MAYRTIADVFDPVGLAMKAAQIKAMQQQEQQAQIQNQLMQQKLAEQQKLQQFAANPQLMTSGPDTQALDKQLQNVATMAQKSIASGNGEALNRINASVQGNEQLKQHMKNSGLGNIEIGQDPKTKDWYQIQTKNWTRNELDNLAEKFPGAKVLGSLPEGEYSINFDPVNKTVRGFSNVSESEGSKVDSTRLSELQMIDLATNHPDPKVRDRFKRTLEESKKYQAEEYSEKYSGGITDKGIDFAAWQYFTTGKMPPMGRSPLVRGKIAERAAELSERLGVSVPDLQTRQFKLGGDKKSFELQTKRYDSMKQFVYSLESQIDRLENDQTIQSIRKNYPKMMNMSIRKIREISARPELGDEANLALKLEEIWQDAARIAGGNTESVGELSNAAQERYRKVFNPDNPAFVTIRLMREVRNSAQDRISAMERALKETTVRMEKRIKFQQEKDNINKPKFVIEAVE